MPAINPDEAAKLALEQFDRNKDGFLDAKELEQCPALLSSVALIDEDKDSKLNAKEIAARIASYKAKQVGLVAVNCRVTRSGRPVAGATVRFVPEKFMGSNIKPAEGVTDSSGTVMPAVEGSNLPGVACGFYRIEVTKKELGNEMISSKYNGSGTVLGVEVAPETAGSTIRLVLQ